MTDPLFPGWRKLPLAPRPPRRLRLLAFQMEQIQQAAEFANRVRQRIEDVEARLAELIARASAAGRVPRDAYRLVVKNEEQRQEVEDSLRRIDEAQRALEDELAKGIERHLAKLGAPSC